MSAESSAELRRWSIASLAVGDPYEAALASEGDPCEIMVRDWAAKNAVC